MPLYLSEHDVEQLVTPAVAIAAVEACFERLARGVVIDRPRQRIGLEDGAFAVMHAVDEELGLAGVKSYAALPGAMPVALLLFSLDPPALAAVIEADRLGRLRTGAASAVAARRLARAGARTLGVIGCGRQGEAHVVCLREALPAIDEVVAYCRDEARLGEFCERLGCAPAESHAEAGGQEIVVTATTSRDPVLRGDWLRLGALVCAVGANDRASRELDNAVVERAAFVCCDSLETARLESGDLIEPVERGVLDWLEVHRLQDVVAGELRGREAEDDIVLFKSNGIAAWDVAVAAAAVELARERGVGTQL